MKEQEVKNAVEEMTGVNNITRITVFSPRCTGGVTWQFSLDAEETKRRHIEAMQRLLRNQGYTIAEDGILGRVTLGCLTHWINKWL